MIDALIATVSNLISVGRSSCSDLQANYCQKAIFARLIAKKAISPAAAWSHHRSGLLESSGHLCSLSAHDDGAPRTPTLGMAFIFCMVSPVSTPLHCLAVVWAPSSGRSLWRLPGRAPTASGGVSSSTQLRGAYTRPGLWGWNLLKAKLENLRRLHSHPNHIISQL